MNDLLVQRVTELEYRQRRNNLIFDGIPEADDPKSESSADCFSKIKQSLLSIPNANVDLCRAERCHRLGQYNKRFSRSIICCFTYYADVSLILENRSHIKKGVYVNEDLPESWSDARRLLRPIHKAAKQAGLAVNWSKHRLHG